jgi:hypothetical protein
LILDRTAVERNVFAIAAYFTISNKPLVFGDGLSKRAVKEIDGFSKDAVSTAAIIIGQLGKDDKYGISLNGSEIIDIIIWLAYKATSIIGGRVIFLECLNEQKLINFYNNNGFSYLQNNTSSGLMQFVRHL